MGRSLRIARVHGIDVRLHITFPLIVLWAALEWGLGDDFSPPDALYGILLVLLLFICVVLHELGHSLVALRYGVQVQDITLLPIGGVAQMRNMPRRPIEELAIALAGPAVNLAIAFTLGLIVWAISLSGPFLTPFRLFRLMLLPSPRGALYYMLAANLGMALFNLLPAFPMDGGRILRSGLAIAFGPLRATQVAARVGQVLAIGFLGAGFYFFSPMTMLIGVFIFAGAMAELRTASARSVLAGITVGEAVVDSTAPALEPDQPLGSVTQLAVFNSEPNFPVVENGKVVGLLHIPELNQAIRDHGPWAPVRDAMKVDFISAQAADSLLDVERLLVEQGVGTVQVYDGSRFRGVLTRQQIVQLYNRLMGQPALAPAKIGTLSSFITKKPL